MCFFRASSEHQMSFSLMYRNESMLFQQNANVQPDLFDTFFNQLIKAIDSTQLNSSKKEEEEEGKKNGSMK